MQGFIRKFWTGGLVFLTLVLGGGFASAAGNDPAETFHTVTYEVLSFRAISLSSAAPVAIGYVRQGSEVVEVGPTLRYATTWAGDQITAVLDSDVAPALNLWIKASTPVAPLGPTAPCDADGEGTAEGSQALTSTPVTIINSITDCGLDTSPGWIGSLLTFRLDATQATEDEDYTGPEEKTVTYVIDAPSLG